MLKEQIAASLEIAFSQHGFAEQSVAQLKTACNVSLRTLYKHYTSKEMMIVAALEHCHQRYLQFLASGHATSGEQRILDIFDKLNDWMKTFAPNGCMSMNALAAFPENVEIKSQGTSLFSGIYGSSNSHASVKVISKEAVDNYEQES